MTGPARDLAQSAAACGVEMGYHDVEGRYHHAPASTVRAIIEALQSGDALDRTPLSLRPGDELGVQGGTILTEDGETLTAGPRLPADFPWGYHSILAGGQRVPRRLIVGPGRCFYPAGLRTWGWAAQLYSLRSSASWGIGDLSDLSDLGAWSSEQGAGAIMLNPLGAVSPGRPMQPSPYSACSRCYRNPVYLGLDHLCAGDPVLTCLSERGRALNGGTLIDRDRSWQLKSEALEHLFNRFPGDHRFDDYCRQQGSHLEDFAVFCALCEQHRGSWPSWPESLRRPQGAGIARFKSLNASRIQYHRWLQWLVDGQLAGAAQNIGLIQDLPVGVNPAGADPWIFENAFAPDFTVGAPADSFNTGGQDWGIAPLHPASLTGAGLDCFVQMLRSGFAHAAGLRMDHVMGMFRLFWIPKGGEPQDGAYVRYPSRLLLDILAIESHRAGAFVVGEDLGTVEQGVREQLQARSILSYRLLLFESNLEAIPELAMAAATNHDLPTLAGLWTGSDLLDQRGLGLNPSEQGAATMMAAVAGAAGLIEPVSEVISAAHARLARSRAAVVMVTLEDAVGSGKRPNMPGTIEQWPNWRLPLPLTLEQLEADPAVISLARTMSNHRPAPG